MYRYFRDLIDFHHSLGTMLLSAAHLKCKDTINAQTRMLCFSSVWYGALSPLTQAHKLHTHVLKIIMCSLHMRKWRCMKMMQLYLYLLLSLAPSICQCKSASQEEECNEIFVSLQQFAMPLAQCRLQAWLEWGCRCVLKHCADPAMADVFLYCHKCSESSSQASEAIGIALEWDEMHDVLSNTPKLLFFSH